MLGAIFGDIAGSAYEFANTYDYDFEMLGPDARPTDDSYMTLAVAKALLEVDFGAADNADRIKAGSADHDSAADSADRDERIKAACVRYMQEIGRKHPNAGYGGHFLGWLADEHPEPYNSFGNGSAMRVSAAGWLYDDLDEVLHTAALTAEVTHDHPEGIKGAQAIAAAILMARKGRSDAEPVDEIKAGIKAYVAGAFDYDLDRTLDEIRPDYRFYEICQKSVPEAIIAFLEGEDYEDTIRKAVTLGGDSDTIACMSGGIAEALYGMPGELRQAAFDRLDPESREIVERFQAVTAE